MFHWTDVTVGLLRMLEFSTSVHVGHLQGKVHVGPSSQQIDPFRLHADRPRQYKRKIVHRNRWGLQCKAFVERKVFPCLKISKIHFCTTVYEFWKHIWPPNPHTRCRKLGQKVAKIKRDTFALNTWGGWLTGWGATWLWRWWWVLCAGWGLVGAEL